VERARALIRRMAEWAAGARAVFAVIQLPLNGVEEQVPSRAHYPTARASWLLVCS